jgi:hypothetical protein
MQILPLQVGASPSSPQPLPGLFRVAPSELRFDPRRFRMMNGRLWRIVGGTSSSPTLMGVDLASVVVQDETPFQAEMDAAAGMGGLGDLTAVEVLSVQSAQANGAVAMLAAAAGQGTATPSRIISAWQTSWNTRKSAVEAAARQLGNAALADAVRARTLVVDGVWGPNTAFTTAVWISSTMPATRLADMPAWWRANGGTVAGARDRIAEAYRAASAAPAAVPEPAPVVDAPPPPPAEPAPTQAPAFAPLPLLRPQAVLRPGAPPASTSSSGGADAAGPGAGMLVLGAVAVGGLIWWMSRSKSGGRALAGLDGAPKRARRKKGPPEGLVKSSELYRLYRWREDAQDWDLEDEYDGAGAMSRAKRYEAEGGFVRLDDSNESVVYASRGSPA